MKNIVLYGRGTKWIENSSFLLAGADRNIIKVFVMEELLELIKSQNIHLLLIADIYSNLKIAMQNIQCIRESTAVPIIIISSQSNEMAKIMLLNAGADDYMTILDNPSVLSARVNAHLRRYTELHSLSNNLPNIYRFGELEVDDTQHIVRVCGKDVKMTPIEFKILSLLIRERGKVFSIQQIYEKIWKMQAIDAENVVAVHIRHVREKIEPNPKNPKYLKVVRGAGYKVG